MRQRSQPDNRGLVTYLLVGLLLPQELLAGEADSIDQQEVPVLPRVQLPDRQAQASVAPLLDFLAGVIRFSVGPLLPYYQVTGTQ